MMIKYYQLTENEINNKPFEGGSLYFATDTSRFYLDPIDDQTRISFGGDPIILPTEIDKDNLFSPIPGKIYMVLESSSTYVYYNDIWYKTSPDTIPPCSEENDGYFLRSIGGAPKWSSVPNAEDSSF